MSFTHKRGSVETDNAVVATGVTVVRGDVLEFNTDGTVKLATSATTVKAFAGVAEQDAVAGAEVIFSVPQEIQTSFEAEVSGGTVVKGQFYDLVDENTIDGSGTTTVDQFRCVNSISATKGEFKFALA